MRPPGETLWVFNPKSYEEGTTPMSGTFRQRGVAYWTDGGGDERIFWGTGAGYLVCVDAGTGEPCPDFGPDGGGKVDAMVGLPRAEREERDYLNAMLYGIHSPPIVVRDRVIHGSQVADRRITKEAVPGWVRAWDVKTGSHAWDFHTVPNSADEFGADTWLNESWRYSGNANVWSMLAGDNELGHVYLPTGTATNDYYGIDRPGDNLFSETIVAVDVETGQRVWHFQAVHHGLWDYDFPTHPNLVDITVDGRGVKALVQVSKQGFVYTFDRVTGEPVWPIEERPVPTDTNMPGEYVSPTQPFPTRPAPFEYQGVTLDDLVDFTPEIREMAVAAVQPYRLGPLFTPISRPVEGGWQGTLMRPPDAGAATWAGAAVDPETGVLYVPSRNNAVVISMYEPDPALGAHRGLHARRPGKGSAGRPRSGAVAERQPHAAGPAPAQAALLADDRHRHEHGGPRLDGAARGRRPVPEPPDAPGPGPAASGRRRVGRSGAHEHAGHQRPLGGRQRRGAASGRTVEGDRRGAGLGGSAHRRPGDADDLPGRRAPAHRAPDRGAPPGDDCVASAGVILRPHTSDRGAIA